MIMWLIVITVIEDWLGQIELNGSTAICDFTISLEIPLYYLFLSYSVIKNAQ